MKILLRLLVLIGLALFGGLAYALTINVLIMTNVIPTETLSNAFGYEMTNRSVIVWMISVVLALVSIFINAKWRYLLLALPVIAPSLFGILYAISLG